MTRHYRAEDAPVFAGTLGLNPLHKAVYSGEEIEEKLCEALRIKNRYDKKLYRIFGADRCAGWVECAQRYSGDFGV